MYGLAYSHTPFGRVLEKRGGVSQADVQRMSLLVLNIAGLQAQGDKRGELDFI